MPSVTDLKVLGPSAVTRAAYEASKALGGHRLTFRPVSGAAISAASPALQLARPDPDTSVAQRCLDDARAVVDDGVLAFGRRTVITSPLDWTRTGPDSSELWADGSWWTIDIRSADRAGDVKWTWEWGRHRDLVVLARASALEPGNEAWIGELDRLLTLWLAATPLEKSVHWYSNLELALRAIAWDQVLQLAGPRLRPETTRGLLLQLTQIRRHLWRDLPYTVSSMRNNHLLGDSLGMMTLDRMLGVSPSGRSTRWARRLFANQLERQFAADGSMVEDSLSYHRFVLEMLATAVLIGERDPRLMSALRDASNHLVSLGALDGGVPQYGDWDEGRVLTTSGDPLDVAGSALLGLALSGERLPSHLWDEHDLLAWYAPRPESATSEGPRAPDVSSSGGLSRAVRGHWNVWLKSGSAPSHGHADLGHVSARVGQEWLLSDPGTGTYNGPIEVRNGFRTSSAHNALVIDGEDQLVPHRAFRWVHRPWTAPGSPIQMGDSRRAVGSPRRICANRRGPSRARRRGRRNRMCGHRLGRGGRGPPVSAHAPAGAIGHHRRIIGAAPGKHDPNLWPIRTGRSCWIRGSFRGLVKQHLRVMGTHALATVLRNDLRTGYLVGGNGQAHALAIWRAERRRTDPGSALVFCECHARGNRPALRDARSLASFQAGLDEAGSRSQPLRGATRRGRRNST